MRVGLGRERTFGGQGPGAAQTVARLEKHLFILLGEKDLQEIPLI